MDKHELAIATMCWARDENEEELLRRSLHQLSLLQIPVYITDGGSNLAFVNYIKSLDHFTVLAPEQPGLWAQVQASINAAKQATPKFILYTEPDKLDFFKQLSGWLYQIDKTKDTGIMLAARTTEGFSSFPEFQQMTETTINNCCANVTSKNLDYTYGPFIFNTAILPHLQNIPDTIGWGWRPYAFIIAVRLGLHISAYSGNFFCPADQQHDDARERVYRMKQLAQNIEGVVLATTTNIQLKKPWI